MAKRTSSVQEAPQAVLDISTTKAPAVETQTDVILDELNTIKATLSELIEAQKNTSSMVVDHDLRLNFLGPDAKPIPRNIGEGLDLSSIFSAITGNVMAKLIVQFYQNKNDEYTMNDHANVAVRAGICVLERIASRIQDSHK
jgi:hypothetical protein